MNTEERERRLNVMGAHNRLVRAISKSPIHNSNSKISLMMDYLLSMLDKPEEIKSLELDIVWKK